MNTITTIPHGLLSLGPEVLSETPKIQTLNLKDFYLAKTFLIFTVKKAESSKSRPLLLFWNVRIRLEFQVRKLS